MIQYTSKKKETSRDAKINALTNILLLVAFLVYFTFSSVKIIVAFISFNLIFILLYVSSFSKKRRYVNEIIFDDVQRLLTIVYIDPILCKEIRKTISYPSINYSYKTAFVYVGSGGFDKVLQIKDKQANKLIVELNSYTGIYYDDIKQVYLKIKSINSEA